MATLKELRDERIRKLEELKKLGIDPYSPRTQKDQPNAEITNNYEKYENTEVTLSGRVMSFREHGGITFADLVDQSGKIQLYIKPDVLEQTGANKQTIGYEHLRLLDIGDFLQSTGIVTKTKSGEISLQSKNIKLLTKSVRPLPDSYEGLKDTDTRYRRRYVDLIINPEVRKIFDRKSKFWEANRQFMKHRGFIEVETPVLEHVTGGADAKPFITHHDALDEDFFLRISTELYLKRLVGGGYEKVFTLAPNFRNEGLSDEHLQEYYQIEWYWAYADYRDNMNMVKEMFRYIANEVYGVTRFEKNGHVFDLANEWEEIDYAQVIKDRFNVDIFKSTDEEIQKVIKENKVNLPGVINRNRLIDNLWKLIRKDISGPAFLVNEPKFMSPLAKSKPENPELTERFHVVIAGSELGNGYTELNDPFDQLERFKDQQAQRDAGDDEAQMMDIDFVEMLEYGMPPTSGYAHSERLFWFLEGVTAREGTLFPQMRYKLDEATKSLYGIQDTKKKAVNYIPSPTYLLSEEVKKDFPGIFYSYTTIENVDITKSNAELEKLKKDLTSKIEKVGKEAIDNSISINAYKALFKATGVDWHSKAPSPLALLTRIIKGKGIYTANTAVDAYNLAVIETTIGLGGFDLDTLAEPISLRYATEGEKMHLLGDEEETVLEAGKIIYTDKNGPITLNLNYRDIDRTKITESTKNIILFADGAPGLTAEEVLAALQKGADYIKRFCGGKQGSIYIVQ